jgi:hypothetical protein
MSFSVYRSYRTDSTVSTTIFVVVGGVILNLTLIMNKDALGDLEVFQSAIVG